jgi:hypothetical protein
MADMTGTLRSVLVGAGVALLVAFAILQTVRVPARAADQDGAGTDGAQEPLAPAAREVA